MGKFIDLTGMRFGRLTITGEGERAKTNRIRWDYVCDCGNVSIILVSTSNLTSGNTSSCGCVHDIIRIKCKTIHGKVRTKEYSNYNSMKTRCYNKNRPEYKYYGARGITVCDEWLNSFEKFLEDMGEQPFSNAEIDRIDVDKGYSKENCRWATSQQNMWNRRKTELKYATSKYKGVSKSSKSDMWVSRITHNGKIHYLGSFKTQIESAVAYNEKALELFGEYAHLNIIEYGEL